MTMKMNDPFSVFKIFIPIVACGFLAICCAGFCKIFYRSRTERLEAQTQSLEQPSVFVIPVSLSDNDFHSPPRYSTVQLYDPPPSYHEVKPEAFGHEPPPAYTETDSPSHS